MSIMNLLIFHCANPSEVHSRAELYLVGTGGKRFVVYRTKQKFFWVFIVIILEASLETKFR